MNLNPSDADECVYTGIISDFVVIIALYMDDLLFASPSMSSQDMVKKVLGSWFHGKDLNEPRLVWGFEIECACKSRLLNLTQTTYKRALLERFNMSLFKLVRTPMESYIDLSCVETAVIEVSYRQVIGSLMYLSVGIRSDISCAVSKLAKHVKNQSKFTEKQQTRCYDTWIALLNWALLIEIIQTSEFMVPWTLIGSTILSVKNQLAVIYSWNMVDLLLGARTSKKLSHFPAQRGNTWVFAQARRKLFGYECFRTVWLKQSSLLVLNRYNFWKILPTCMLTIKDVSSSHKMVFWISGRSIFVPDWSHVRDPFYLF